MKWPLIDMTSGHQQAGGIISHNGHPKPTDRVCIIQDLQFRLWADSGVRCSDYLVEQIQPYPIPRFSMNHKRAIILLALVLLIGSCKAGPEATEPLPPEVIPGSALISEVQAGAQGNNNHEFIEFFNPGEEPLDLESWSLWYRLATSEDDLLVFEWSESMLLPPQGHLLLGREGQDLGIVPDVVFTQALNTGNGALELRDPTGNQSDALGWGGSYPPFTEGTPAAALSNGWREMARTMMTTLPISSWPQNLPPRTAAVH
jgi:hypothetical protein